MALVRNAAVLTHRRIDLDRSDKISQQNVFIKQSSDNSSALRANYPVAHL
jgi:hypothetical protein